MAINFIAFIAFGFSHSLVDFDQALCVLNPLEWIGRNIGYWGRDAGRSSIYCFLTPWILVLIAGICISKLDRSPFWAFLIPILLAIGSIIATSFFGWRFGKMY